MRAIEIAKIKNSNVKKITRKRGIFHFLKHKKRSSKKILVSFFKDAYNIF